MTKLASQLPKHGTGLDDIARQLVENDKAEHLVVGIVKCKDWTHDPETGVDIPTAKFVAIEPVTGVNARTVRRILQETYARRTGQDSLTLDQLEDTTVTIRHGDEEVTTTASELLRHGSGVVTSDDIVRDEDDPDE